MNRLAQPGLSRWKTISDVRGGRADTEASIVEHQAAEKLAAEHYWRDTRLTRIFEGTSEIQLQLISDRLLGKARTR